MKSIRLSLLLYFLVLLAVALGAVSVLAYQYTQDILDAKVQVPGRSKRSSSRMMQTEKSVGSIACPWDNRAEPELAGSSPVCRNFPVNEFNFHVYDSDSPT